MKDLRNFPYFLMAHVIWTSICLFLSQGRYVFNLLHKFHLDIVRFVGTSF